MAVLTDQQRERVWEEYIRDMSEAHGCTKAQLRAAVNAIDDWMEANAAALNAAIPQPARANLSASQKAQLLAAVALRRYGG